MIKKICFGIFLFFVFSLNIILDTHIKDYFKILKECFGKNIVLTNKIYASICLLIALISILIVIDVLLVVFKRKTENKGINFKTEDGTFGTSSWMTENEMKNTLGFDNTPGIILGKYNNKIVKLPFTSNLNKNVCVFGSSGSMKTIGFLITNLLELSKYKKSIICTDPKSEIYRITSSYFRNIGYVVKVLNLKDMKHSNRWNPLQENRDINDVQASSEIILKNTQNQDGGDQFWFSNEVNLLQAFEFYFLETISEKNTLANIYKYLSNDDMKEIDNMFRKLPQGSNAKLSYNTYAKGSETIKASVITGLASRLKIFQNKDLQRLTEESDIDLVLPAKVPCIYYVVTSDMDSTFDFLASLFFTFSFKKIIEYADSRPNGKCDTDVYFYLDEFCNIGEIPDFNKKISTVRSRGVAIIPIIQNLGQLQSRYSEKIADEIIRQL